MGERDLHPHRSKRFRLLDRRTTRDFWMSSLGSGWYPMEHNLEISWCWGGVAPQIIVTNPHKR